MKLGKNTFKKTNIIKGETIMKNKKLKLLVLALAVCLIAVASLGTLAWFTANDSVTNNFYIANSEDDPDAIFSVDVWEDDTLADPDGEEKIQGGLDYENILPGDERYKEVHIENTGYYDQYIRATVTVTGASIWQDVYDMYLVPLTSFVDTIDTAAIHTQVAYYDAAEDAFVYHLYYDKAIAAGQEIIVFDTVKISEALDQKQAAALSGEFKISVVADAVQVENVGDNVYEAFETVGLVKATPISDAAELDAALASEEEARIIVDAAALTNNTLTIDSAIKNKTIDFNGADAAVSFGATATAENVVITGIVDENGSGNDIATAAGFTGDVTVLNCYFKSIGGHTGSAIMPLAGNFEIIDCTFDGDDGAGDYGISHSGSTTGDITISNCTFKNLDSWAILINGAVTGNVTIDNCVFDTQDGVFKTLGGGISGDFAFTNNTMIGVKGHDANSSKIVVSGSGTGPVIAGGTKTVTGNTLDGVEWTQ